MVKISPEHKKLLIEVYNKESESRYEWLRNVIIMASGIISVLVSLHKRSDSFKVKISFCITIILLSLGILIGVISLYGEVRSQTRLRMKYAKSLLQHMNDEAPLPQMMTVPTEPIFVWLEKTCYVLLALSILSMAVYAVMLEF